MCDVGTNTERDPAEAEEELPRPEAATQPAEAPSLQDRMKGQLKSMLKRGMTQKDPAPPPELTPEEEREAFLAELQTLHIERERAGREVELQAAEQREAAAA